MNEMPLKSKALKFQMDSFEGPLELLWHLVQENEIDIYEVNIQKILQQFLNYLLEKRVNIDNSADLVATTACLMLLKSRRLLPKTQETLPKIDPELDSSFSIIHQLIEYCQFKEVSRLLLKKEERQLNHHPRGVSAIPKIKNAQGLPIDHLTLSDLAEMFQNALARMPKTGTITEERWTVGERSEFIRSLLTEQKGFSLSLLFPEQNSRYEHIVTFLALLELLKLGEIRLTSSPEGLIGHA